MPCGDDVEKISEDVVRGVVVDVCGRVVIEVAKGAVEEGCATKKLPEIELKVKKELMQIRNSVSFLRKNVA